MNPWPQSRSVLVMDNCAIHKSEELAQAIHDAGKSLILKVNLILILY